MDDLRRYHASLLREEARKIEAGEVPLYDLHLISQGAYLATAQRLVNETLSDKEMAERLGDSLKKFRGWLRTDPEVMTCAIPGPRRKWVAWKVMERRTKWSGRV